MEKTPSVDLLYHKQQNEQNLAPGEIFMPVQIVFELH